MNCDYCGKKIDEKFDGVIGYDGEHFCSVECLHDNENEKLPRDGSDPCGA